MPPIWRPAGDCSINDVVICVGEGSKKTAGCGSKRTGTERDFFTAM